MHLTSWNTVAEFSKWQPQYFEIESQSPIFYRKNDFNLVGIVPVHILRIICGTCLCAY